MTREKAIRHFERYVNDDCYTIEHREACRMAVAALREQEELRWIPVEERLPDLIPCGAGTAYSEAVIVLTSERKVMEAVWDGIDFCCAADYWDAEGEEITHWTPVPELPKEVAE